MYTHPTLADVEIPNLDLLSLLFGAAHRPVQERASVG